MQLPGSAGSGSFPARVLQHLLPSCCLLCNQSCPARLVCPACEADLPRIIDCCSQCALPSARPGDLGNVGLCADCLRYPPPWDHAIAALWYEYPVDHLVRHFKFHRDMACGQLLANELTRAVRLKWSRTDSLAGETPDILIPVPLHFLRRFMRGFNQAEVIAVELAKTTGILLQRNLLRRTRRTPAQSGLAREARQRNLKNAFSCEPLHGQHVALVDDVLTTGATLQECARVLKAAGASRVTVWVTARVPAPSG